MGIFGGARLPERPLQVRKGTAFLATDPKLLRYAAEPLSQGRPPQKSEGRCIPDCSSGACRRLQLLQLPRLDRSDAPGLSARLTRWMENTVGSFRAAEGAACAHVFRSGLTIDLLLVQGRNVSNAAPLRQGCWLPATCLIRPAGAFRCRLCGIFQPDFCLPRSPTPEI
jgi:hypothetical protein